MQSARRHTRVCVCECDCERVRDKQKCSQRDSTRVYGCASVFVRECEREKGQRD